MLLLQWDGAEEIVHIPPLTVETQPTHTSPELERAMASYAEWSTRAIHWTESVDTMEQHARPTLLPSEQAALAGSRDNYPVIVVPPSEEDPDDDYDGQLAKYTKVFKRSVCKLTGELERCTLWDLTKTKGFCHFLDEKKHLEQKLPAQKAPVRKQVNLPALSTRANNPFWKRANNTQTPQV